MFVDTDDGVVAWEAELLIRSQKPGLVSWNIDEWLLDLTLLLLEEPLPGCDIRKCLDRIGPLTAEQASRWVLEVQGKEQSVLFVKVDGVHVCAQTHCFDEYLAEGICVHLLAEIAPLELILPLGVFFLEQLLESLQNDQSLSLVGDVRVEL